MFNREAVLAGCNDISELRKKGLLIVDGYALGVCRMSDHPEITVRVDVGNMVELLVDGEYFDDLTMPDDYVDHGTEISLHGDKNVYIFNKERYKKEVLDKLKKEQFSDSFYDPSNDMTEYEMDVYL